MDLKEQYKKETGKSPYCRDRNGQFIASSFSYDDKYVKWLEQLALCNVSCSLPSKEEIFKQARKEENYIGNESDIVGAEKSGKYHGFLKGVEWLSSKLK